MKWADLINEIYILQEEFPEELANLFIVQDENYVNKYAIWLTQIDYLDEIDEWEPYEAMTFIDNELDYDYNSNYLVYLKLKNWEGPVDIYNNHLAKGFSPTENGFVQDFLFSIISF